ncbi:hypothetical protein PIB30_026451 [Stylosanthes scabra]|uniref:Uncharacterized protein n=1 Tax=Stylosanthes scabra TaxID=79078 RepID=A0ABU6V8I4_9FABA|nr:hypothetical protein [Stylosanthes scabra]
MTRVPYSIFLTWLHPVTPFLNVPTPPARDKGFQLQRRKSAPRAAAPHHFFWLGRIPLDVDGPLSGHFADPLTRSFDGLGP